MQKRSFDVFSKVTILFCIIAGYIVASLTVLSKIVARKNVGGVVIQALACAEALLFC